ncbi:unnamed protein product, partial [Polarella glacialis]
LACAGDYFSIFRRFPLADLQYKVVKVLAEQLAPTKKGSSASSGGSVDEAGEVPEALDAAIGCVWMLVEAEGVRKQEIALSSLEDDFQTAIWERRVCQCYHLLDDIVAFYGKQGAVKHAALGVDLQLEVLSASSEFLSTPAAGPIESLARRWLAPEASQLIFCLKKIKKHIRIFVVFVVFFRARLRHWRRWMQSACHFQSLCRS